MKIQVASVMLSRRRLVHKFFLNNKEINTSVIICRTHLRTNALGDIWAGRYV